jgi:hypothetical protein
VSDHRTSIVRVVLSSVALAGAASPSFAQVFDYAIQGVRQDDSLGSAISRVGDLDGDGCDEFIVGAPQFYKSTNEGSVTIYSGQTGAVIVTLTGNAPAGSCSEFGFDVESKIDVDADGYPDVIIGAPSDTTGGTLAGRVLVYSPHLGQTIYDLSGTTNQRLGQAIRSLSGDLDGDGIEDFIVGNRSSNTAFVYSGASGAQIFSLTGQGGSWFGWAVSAGGNLNGDAFADFLIGSPTFVDTSGRTTGRVAAFSGKDKSRLWAINGPPNSWFGEAIAEPGDLDGDGVSDLLVGAPKDLDASSVATGSVTAFSGKTGAILFTLYGDADGDDFGEAVRGVSDIDGDGITDFVVGAPAYDAPTHPTSGYAKLYSGTGALLHAFTQHSSDPLQIMEGYGFGLAGADVDGDGRRDLLIGNQFFNLSGIVEVWRTAGASWQNYSSGWPGTLGVPGFTALNAPVVGQSLALDLTNSLGSTTSGLLALGFAQASIHIKNSGTLLVSPSLWLPLSIPAPDLKISGSIPDDPSLYGLHVYLQALELDAGASKNFSFTPGLDLLFGFP